MSESVKFLYGASVQGIQSFIFKTNKLKEIVGASELVERICTNQFDKLLESFGESKENIGEAITQAAGNVKFLFNSEEACRHVVLNFPKQIMEYAPGISISQAVVKLDGELSIENLNELEEHLKAQRNKPIADLERGLLVTERSSRTGLPAIDVEDFAENEKKESYKGDNQSRIDKASYVKQRSVRRHYGDHKQKETSRGNLAHKFLKEVTDDSGKSRDFFTYKKGEKVQFNYNTDCLSLKDEKSYIAVIHADGNNLGKIIQQLGNHLNADSKESSIKQAYSNFSQAIDEATRQAAQFAFYQTFKKRLDKVKESGNPNKTIDIPFRPVVLSGDDLTVICEAKYAMTFTRHFLEKFEKTSKAQIYEKLSDFNLSIDKLTACAGIAFVKNKFPFYYAVDLAEALCSEAKKVSKEHIKGKENADVPSSLHFYKVESTYVDSYKQIKERTLKASGVNMEYGPYFINKDMPANVEDLLVRTAKLNEKEAPASHLRRWLSALNNSVKEATLLMQRTCEVLGVKNPYIEQLNLNEAIADGKTHIHDIVALASVTKQKEE